jgi:hypothetical protein
MADTLTLLKQQFSVLCEQRDAILALSNPLRAERDAATVASEAALAVIVDPLNAEIVRAEVGLPALMNEIAQIANALNGQTAA